eukprot:GHVQ01020123.1.p1 GENE.GHVQ01020123.1~~GHVQ01020123.1.p1  ORF type:complete len:394 (+),score=62.75 GHVQ01020123.1:108-1289(+)
MDGVRTKQAAEVGRRAVDYFRGSDFRKWVMTNTEMIQKKFGDALDGMPLDKPEDADRLGDRLIRKGFICRAVYKPLSGTTQEKNDEGKIPKWPKRLQTTGTQLFDESGFFIIVYEGSKTWSYLMLGAIITVVLFLCMFPAWPLKMKVGVWYCSVFFMTFIIGLVVLRLFVFLIFWFFGVDMWIMPNLFDEEAGVVDSLLPLLSCEYRKDDWIMVAARAFCFVLFVASIYQLHQTHSVSDIQNFAKQSLLDVLDWGHQKLAAVPANTPKYPSIKDIEEFSDHSPGNETDASTTQSVAPDAPDPTHTAVPADTEEDYRCLKPCGYSSYEELLEDCLMACACMNELVVSPCFKKCNASTKDALHEAKRDACYEQEHDSGPAGSDKKKAKNDNAEEL